MGSMGEGLRNSAAASIRKMSSHDIPAALRILRESQEAAMWPESSLVECCAKGNAWVAEADGRVAGILIAQIAADELEILNVAVAIGDRRRGVAFRLVNFRLVEAFAQGVREAYLELRASNAAALAFYTRLGFQICGRRAGYYRNPVEDATLMVLHSPDQNY